MPQFAATIPDLADNSRANGFGAAPVKKIELDTHVVANADPVQIGTNFTGFLSG